MVACDIGSTTPIGAAAAPASGTPSGVSGSASAGQAAGGAAGQAGSASGAGMSGTGTAGAAAGSSGSGGGGGGAGTAGSSGSGNGGGSGGGAACAGALFCDDFESYTDAPGAPWTIQKNQGNVTIDSTKAKSGTKAAKFTTTGAAAYQQAFIKLTTGFPVAGNAFYGRMMIFATQAAKDGVHWTMIQGDGAAADAGITSAKVRYGGQQQKALMANYDSAPKKSDCYKHSATKMPEGKWACMEWYFEGPTNTQKFWLDGAAIEDLTVVEQGTGCLSDETQNKWIFPTFASISLGWESYQTDDAREVWIDDVAIGTAKIGCPQ